MTPINASTPVTSSFASDPDMRELIQEFAAEMPHRARELRDLWDNGRYDDLKRLAHQLKGAGAGYGFEVLTRHASAVEEALKESTRDMARLKSGVDELVELCARVVA